MLIEDDGKRRVYAMVCDDPEERGVYRTPVRGYYSMWENSYGGFGISCAWLPAGIALQDRRIKEAIMRGDPRADVEKQIQWACLPLETKENLRYNLEHYSCE